MENNKAIIKILEQIMDTPELFDSDVASTIVKKIGNDVTDIHYKDFLVSRNFRIHGNIWPRICVNALLNDKAEQKNNWEHIFKDNNILTTNEKCTVDYTSFDKFNTDFFPVLASPQVISFIHQGFIFYEQLKKDELTKEEELLIAIDLLNPAQEKIFFAKSDRPALDYENYEKYIVDLLVKHRENICSKFSLNNTEFIVKVLESHSLRQIIRHIDPIHLQELISSNDLRVIHSKASLMENVKLNRNMFNNLLPLATPENWLKAYMNKNKNFNILGFFDNKFFLATNKDIHKNLEEVKRGKGIRKEPDAAGDTSTKQQILEEFSYLLPAIRNVKIKDKDIIQWYRMLIKTNFVELFELSSKTIAIPSRNKLTSSKEEDMNLLIIQYESLLKNLKNITNNPSTKEMTKFYDIYEKNKTEILANNLNKDLNEKSDIKKVKL